MVKEFPKATRGKNPFGLIIHKQRNANAKWGVEVIKVRTGYDKKLNPKTTSLHVDCCKYSGLHGADLAWAIADDILKQGYITTSSGRKVKFNWNTRFFEVENADL